MESSETRAARLGAERCRDRALEERGLAPGKKNAARLGAHIVFADESGFLLAPLVVRTWAPRGCTPVVRCRQISEERCQVENLIFSTGPPGKFTSPSTVFTHVSHNASALVAATSGELCLTKAAR